MDSVVKSALCLLLLASLQSVTECFSSGAPDGACAGVSPDPTRHSASPQITDVPYVLTGLPPTNYTPGMPYTLMLAGNSSEMFRGFLVVAWNSANERVGTFTPMAADGQTACADSRGITHTGGADKSTVSFTWTAPPQGTGAVDIRFAVVQRRVMYWANELAANLQEGNPAIINLPGVFVTMLFAVLGVSMMVGF